jgi:hypothetical protein
VPNFADQVSASAYSKMISIGVSLARVDFSWTQAAQWDFSAMDARMSAARAAGMNILALLNGLPFGATDAQYGEFCRAVVARYPDLGMVEVQNEPSLNNVTDARYVGLLRSCSSAVKAARPEVIVLGATENPRYFATILSAGPWPTVDKWAIHPYTDPHENGPDTGTGEFAYDEVRYRHDQAVAAGQGKPMWITEMGWSTAVDCTDNAYWCRNHVNVSESTQAQYMGRAIDRCFIEWAAFCEKFIAYSYRDNAPTTDGFFDHFGALRYDGSAKPLWTVIDGKT